MSKFSEEHSFLNSMIQEAMTLKTNKISKGLDNDMLVLEQAILEEIDDVNDFINDNDDEVQEMIDMEELTEASIQRLLEAKKTVVRFNKKDKISRAKAQQIIGLAKKDNNNDYKKLVKVWKMRDILWKRLEARYGSKAESKARQAVQRANKLSKQKTNNTEKSKKVHKTDFPATKK